MPKVSIIVPVYNKAKYLSAMFDALISQTYQDWEIIVVDDGSTDGSSTIIEEYRSKEPRMYVITQKNSGVSAARNQGIKKALGEWIWFVDADDIPERNFLKNAFAVDYDNTTNIIVGEYQRLESSGETHPIRIEEHGIILPEQFPDLFMKYQYKNGFWGYLWNKLIRRSLIVDGQCQFQEGLMLAEDLEFMVSLYKTNTSIYTTPYLAMRYTVDAVNASKEKKIDYWSQLQIQMEIKDWIVDDRKKINYVDFFRWQISRYAAFTVYYGCENKEDYLSFAKMLAREAKVSKQLTTSQIDPVMKPIVWCLMHKQFLLLKAYLLTRTRLRTVYHAIRQ